jgi:hypothetical protein
MKNVLALICLMISFCANAQLGAPLRKNILMIEYSHWGWYSTNALTLNYERVFLQKGAINYYMRVGAGEWGGPWNGSGNYFGPKCNLGLGAFLGKRSHHLDIQAGPEMYIATGSDTPSQYYKPLGPEFHAYALAGYRYQEPGRPLMFRLAVSTYGMASVAVGFAF